LAERQPGHGRHRRALEVRAGWTLSLLVPEPRLEWAIGPRVALFVGGSLRGGTFRVAGDFGRTRGRPSLDHEYVDYRELAASAGVRWHLSPTTTLQAGVGRVFDGGSSFTNAICCSTATAPPWSSSA